MWCMFTGLKWVNYIDLFALALVILHANKTEDPLKQKCMVYFQGECRFIFLPQGYVSLLQRHSLNP